MQWVENDLNNEKNPKPKRKFDILKETFVEFCQRTDTNAIGKIFEYENSFVKLTMGYSFRE